MAGCADANVDARADRDAEAVERGVSDRGLEPGGAPRRYRRLALRYRSVSHPGGLHYGLRAPQSLPYHEHGYT